MTELTDGVWGGVSTDGEIAVVGDTQAFDSAGPSCYVCRRGPGGPTDWSLEAVRTSPEPNTEWPDLFGGVVAAHGQVTVMGASGAPAREFHSAPSHIHTNPNSGP